MNVDDIIVVSLALPNNVDIKTPTQIISNESISLHVNDSILYIYANVALVIGSDALIVSTNVGFDVEKE